MLQLIRFQCRQELLGAGGCLGSPGLEQSAACRGQGDADLALILGLPGPEDQTLALEMAHQRRDARGADVHGAAQLRRAGGAAVCQVAQREALAPGHFRQGRKAGQMGKAQLQCQKFLRRGLFFHNIGPPA